MYYTSESTVQAKIVVTLSAYQPTGNLQTKTHWSERPLSVDELFSTKPDLADRILLTVNFVPDTPPVNDNSVGFRVYRASRTEGIYPAHQISSISNRANHPQCYLDSYKVGECISFALLSGKDEEWVWFYSDSGTIKEAASADPQFVLSCKVPYSETICVIPKSAYIVNMEITRPNKMIWNVMPLIEYTAWQQEEKDWYYEFKNDLETIYLATCPPSCKQII